MPKRKSKEENKTEPVEQVYPEFPEEDAEDASDGYVLRGDRPGDVTDVLASVPPEPEEMQLPPLPPTPEKSDSERSLPRIPLRVFEKIAGARPDQLAGFLHYAKKNNLGPLTVPEWREAREIFRTKPTK